VPLQHTLLLCINGDDWLTSRLKGHDLTIDMVELCVAVGVVAAFLRLAVHLA
jgi:hypothetical protein